MRAEELQESNVVILERDEDSINHQNDLSKKIQQGEISAGIVFLSLENLSLMKNLIFLDERGQKISRLGLYEHQNFIRNPFRENVFHIFNSAVYEQFEQERFFHFKEVAHLLGLKHCELHKENKDSTTKSIKASLKGVFPIDGEKGGSNLDVSSFFTEEEYWPLQNNPNVEFFKRSYEEAKQYASSHYLENALDFRDLLLCRSPDNNPIKTKIIRYSFLSCVSSCFKLAMNLSNVQKIISASWPPAAFFPNGFSFEKKTISICEQSVNLKLDFFNFSNANLPVWESSDSSNERYSFFMNHMEMMKNKFLESCETKNDGLLEVPDAETYISPTEKKNKQIEKIRNCIGTLQDNQKKGSLNASLFNDLMSLLKSDFKYKKEDLDELRVYFENVFPDDSKAKDEFKVNIDEIKNAFLKLTE